jgi:hypothetical protein
MLFGGPIEAHSFYHAYVSGCAKSHGAKPNPQVETSADEDTLFLILFLKKYFLCSFYLSPAILFYLSPTISKMKRAQATLNTDPAIIF